MFNLEAVGYLKSERDHHEDDHWGGARCTLTLSDAFGEEALASIESFSHLEIIFLMDQVDEQHIERGARHPRNRQDWPLVGIFAQRGRKRPNRLGLSVCRLIKVEGKTLTLADLDALDGTPVLDIKPYMEEFAPRHPVRQPQWSRELMDRYYLEPDSKP